MMISPGHFEESAIRQLVLYLVSVSCKISFRNISPVSSNFSVAAAIFILTSKNFNGSPVVNFSILLFRVNLSAVVGFYKKYITDSFGFLDHHKL